MGNKLWKRVVSSGAGNMVAVLNKMVKEDVIGKVTCSKALKEVEEQP